MTRHLLAILLSLSLAFSALAADDPASLAQQAMKAYSAGQYAQSADLFAAAVAGGATNPGVLYNAACASALAGRSGAAFDFLTQAIGGGFNNPEQLKADKDFASLHASPRWTEIVGGLEKQKAEAERLWSSPALATPYSRTLSEDERIAGLSRIWSEAKFNFVYFDRLPELDWDALYLSFLPKVRAAASTTDYYRILTLFIAQLKDGHTGINYPQEVLRELWGEPALRLGELEGHVVVTDVFDGALGVERGAELLAVDGVPVREYAAREVTPYQTASTPQDLAARTWRRLLWGAESSFVELTLANADGARVTRRVRRLTSEEEKKIKPELPPFELRMLRGNIAYVALNEFGDAKAAEEFEAKFDEIAKADGLILDVRRNGGGNGSNGYRVLSCLTAKPFQTSRWSTRLYKPSFRAWGRPAEMFEQGSGEVPPSGKRLYTKPVIVLTGASTYSAAEDFTVAFDAMKRGTIVGEPTGGSTGQPLPVKLPGGGSFRVCTKHDSYPDGKEFVGVGVQPQLLVRPKLADLRAGRDTVLEAALAQFGGAGRVPHAR